MTERSLEKHQKMSTEQTNPRLGKALRLVLQDTILPDRRERKRNFQEASLEQVLASLFQTKHGRENFLKVGYDILYEEGKEVKENGNIVTDLLVIGAGPNGIATARSASVEGIDVIVIDKSKQVAGPFGKDGIFRIATRNTERPKENQYDAEDSKNPNSVGTDAVVQVKDFTGEWPDSDHLHVAVLANALASGKVLLGTEAEVIKYLPDDTFVTYTKDLETGKPIQIHSRSVACATGLGEPYYGQGVDVEEPQTKEALAAIGNKIYSVDDWRQAIENISDKSLINLTQNGLSIIGGGESAKMIMERLAERLSAIPSPLKNSIHIQIYGAPYTSKEEYVQNTFLPRYGHLADYFPQYEGDKNALFIPFKDKLVGFFIGENGRVGLRLQRKGTEEIKVETGTVICATGYKNTVMKLLGEFIPTQSLDKLEDIYGTFARSPDPTFIAKHVPGVPLLLVVGPATEAPPSAAEQKRGLFLGSGLRRMVPLSSRVGKDIAQMLQEMKS